MVVRYSAMGLGRKRKRAGARRKMRGKGIGEFLAGGLSGLGTGLGRGASNLLSGLFGGARRRKRAAPRVRKVRRVRRVRRVRGRGVLGDLNDLAKETQVVSKALNKFGPGWLGSAAAKLGYGRLSARTGASARKRGRGYRTIVW